VSVAAPLEIAVALAAVAAALAYFVFLSFLFGAGYQPSPRAAALEMLRLAGVGPSDVVYDLGAGTGALVFRAVRRNGARAVAIEVEPIRVFLLRLRRRFGPGRERLTIRWGNLFDVDLSPATVIATFLWPGAMGRLRPKLEAELRPGARVVSHCHRIPGWTEAAYDRATDVYLYRWPEAVRAAGFTAGGR
jgi:hypothetical protein